MSVTPACKTDTNEITSKLERRVLALPELRILDENEGDAGGKKLSGYAAVFNQLSEFIQEFFAGFREKIAPGAFANTLRKGADVRLLINHEGLPLARTNSGTLKLSEDNHGLKFEAEVDLSDPDVQRVLPKLRRGDLSQMSFGFVTLDDKWELTEAKERIRTLVEVDLFDISLVTYPAYPQTNVGLRSARDVYDSYLATLQVQEEAVKIAQSQLRAQAAARQRYLDLVEKQIRG